MTTTRTSKTDISHNKGQEVPVPCWHAEEIFGRRVHMDEASVGREGRNAVGHVQEQGVQLVALALHLADRCLETARHVVERARQLTDLVARLHAEVLIEVALRD